MSANQSPRSKEEIGQLITSCQGLVRSIAWKIHRRLPSHVDIDDLVGYGQVGLAEAARDFDMDRRTEFTTYAYYRIRGSILDGLGRLAWFNRADYDRGQYEYLEQEALQAEGRASSGSSAGDTLTDDVRWLRRATGALAVVYLISQESDEGGRRDEIADRERTPVESVIQSELHHRLRKLIETLPDDARQLIQGTYFEGLTLKEAGERIGISKAWASRLHAKTLRSLALALAEETD